MDSKLEKLANELDNRFVRIEDRMVELTSYFGRIYDQLHVLCEVVLSNKWNNSMNGRNVISEGGLMLMIMMNLIVVLMTKCPPCIIIFLELILNLKR